MCDYLKQGLVFIVKNGVSLTYSYEEKPIRKINLIHVFCPKSAVNVVCDSPKTRIVPIEIGRLRHNLKNISRFIFKKIASFVDRESFVHDRVVFNPNGTMTFIPKHPLTWVPELNEGRSEDDMLILPNIALLVSSVGQTAAWYAVNLSTSTVSFKTVCFAELRQRNVFISRLYEDGCQHSHHPDEFAAFGADDGQRIYVRLQKPSSHTRQQVYAFMDYVRQAWTH